MQKLPELCRMYGCFQTFAPKHARLLLVKKEKCTDRGPQWALYPVCL